MKITVNWDEIQIKQAELDSVFHLNLFSTWAIDISRLILLHKRKYLKSVLITEISLLFLGLLLFFPVNLILLGNLNLLTNNISGFILIVAIAIVFSTILLLILNYYLWQKAKNLKSLTLILEKINDYNCLIDNLKIITELNSLNSTNEVAQNNLNLSSEIKTALTLTKDSLIKSIELEKFINRNRTIRRDSYQLFNNLEENLIQFISLPHHNLNNDYQKALGDIIQIGLSVHQEIRKIQTLR
jgi:hypothetical protein